MRTRNVSLTDEQDKFVHERVVSGRYANASDVIRAALRALEHEEQARAAQIDAIREALEAGERSGFVDDFSMQRLIDEVDAENSKK